MTGQPPPGGPLRLTLARWYNQPRDREHIGGVCDKIIATTGPYDQYRYGTDNPAPLAVADDERHPGGLQVCLIGSPWTGVFFIDVDSSAVHGTTRLAELVGPEHAASRRGDGFHVIVDARHISPDKWPTQGAYYGADGLKAGDIKSMGFIPVPGSRHWTGELYQPVLHPGNRLHIHVCTDEILAAIKAARPAGSGSRSGNGSSSSSSSLSDLPPLPPLDVMLEHGVPHNHDDNMLRLAGQLAAQGKSWGQAHPILRQVADRTAETRPWTDADLKSKFDRGVKKGYGKVAEITPAMQQVAQQLAGPQQQQQQIPPVTWAQAEAVYARWLHDADQVPTRIVLAAFAANMFLPGDPVWVMLVGGSGIGKTERIMPIAAMPHVVMASTLTGEAALLSASPKRERAKNATGGALRQIGDHGVLVIKDFTSVLSMSRDRRAEVIAALREVYDGRWDRHYGTDGGQVLSWSGHCGFIAGCTTAIDTAHSVLDAMGTRFLFIRLPDADPDKIGRSALAHTGHEAQMRAELAQVTAGLLGNLGRPHEIHEGVREWLLPLAALASLGRSPVERDYQGEIALVGDAEAPTRLIKQLGQLWRGCGMLGLDEARSWEAVRRAGLDSIPKLRRSVIEHLGRSAGTWQATTEVARAVRHPSRTTLRTLEDLDAHGIVDRYVEQLGPVRKTYSWALSEQAGGWWAKLNPPVLTYRAS